MIDVLLRYSFTRFCLVGGSATALQFALLAAFVELAAVGKVFASALSYGLSSLFNYWLNYHLTFGSQQRHCVALPRFALVAGLGMLINTCTFALVLSVGHYLLAQAVATLVTLAVNFILHKHWTYRSKR